MKISDNGEEITGGGMNQMPGPGNGRDGNMPAPGGDGSMPPQGDRPAKPDSIDGTTQATPESPDGETNDSETGTATINN